jgi:Sugar phosphate isomerases/epimerases
MKRRLFLKTAVSTVAFASLPLSEVFASSQQKKSLPVKTKISLNAYSFNNPLRSGEMNLDDLLEYAAKTGFEGVDLTGYYFPGYPQAPTDEYIYHIKHKAFSLGIEICGTGVRNNFVSADVAVREAEKKHVKEWILVASKLGAQTLRIFAGDAIHDGYTREQAFQWVVSSVKECAEYAKQHGVILAIQNHDDFLKTADQVEELLKAVNSEWVGLMLDIGSYRTTSDSFAEIEQTIKYAITWQIKEEMYVNQQVVKTDLDKLKRIIDASDFRGYLPIETLGAGDPKQKVDIMFKEVKKRFP